MSCVATAPSFATVTEDTIRRLPSLASWEAFEVFLRECYAPYERFSATELANNLNVDRRIIYFRLRQLIEHQRADTGGGRGMYRILPAPDRKPEPVIDAEHRAWLQSIRQRQRERRRRAQVPI